MFKYRYCSMEHVSRMEWLRFGHKENKLEVIFNRHFFTVQLNLFNYQELNIFISIYRFRLMTKKTYHFTCVANL